MATGDTGCNFIDHETRVKGLRIIRLQRELICEKHAPAAALTVILIIDQEADYPHRRIFLRKMSDVCTNVPTDDLCKHLTVWRKQEKKHPNWTFSGSIAVNDYLVWKWNKTESDPHSDEKASVWQIFSVFFSLRLRFHLKLNCCFNYWSGSWLFCKWSHQLLWFSHWWVV